jgi:hypothetical protein
LAKFLVAWAILATILTGTNLGQRVDRAVPPALPVSTSASGVAVVGIDIDRPSRTLATTILKGESPFSTAALNSVDNWAFAV